MKSKTQQQMVFLVTLLLTDALAAALAFIVGYWLRHQVDWPAPAEDMAALADYAGMIAAHVGAVLTALAVARQYKIPRAPARVDEFYAVVGATTLGTLMGVAFGALAFKHGALELDYSRGVVLYAWLFTVILVALGRLVNSLIRSQLRKRGSVRDRVLIVGTGEVGQVILQKLRSNPGLGYEVVGFATADGGDAASLDAPILGKAGDLVGIINEHDIDEVIIAMPEATHHEIMTLIAECERGKVTIRVFPDVFQIIAGPVSVGELVGLPLLTVRDVALRGWRRVAKRAVDLIGSSLALVFLSPLMLLMALLIKLDSRGPVFYAQERMGMDAKPFHMLKFRSMREDAEANGPGWTVKDDPRVTRLGRVLRRIDIDELPQLVNVLVGDMSLVGPRPERPIYVNRFRRSIPRYMDRHWEKSGMTGWAQVNGLRGDTSIAERTKYDLWYNENWSLLLDFKIVLRTILNVFRSAYSADTVTAEVSEQ
jgi:exopolysaccharide biosynthesis polyprenyl glycosylphosphotransferase